MFQPAMFVDTGAFVRAVDLSHPTTPEVTPQWNTDEKKPPHLLPEVTPNKSFPHGTLVSAIPEVW